MAGPSDTDTYRHVCNLNRPAELHSLTEAAIGFEIGKRDDHVLTSYESRLSAVRQEFTLCPHFDIKDPVFAKTNLVALSKAVGVDRANRDSADTLPRTNPGQADPYGLVVPEVGTVFLVVRHDPQLDFSCFTQSGEDPS